MVLNMIYDYVCILGEGSSALHCSRVLYHIGIQHVFFEYSYTKNSFVKSNIIKMEIPYHKFNKSILYGIIISSGLIMSSSATSAIAFRKSGSPQIWRRKNEATLHCGRGRLWSQGT